MEMHNFDMTVNEMFVKRFDTRKEDIVKKIKARRPFSYMNGTFTGQYVREPDESDGLGGCLGAYHIFYNKDGLLERDIFTADFSALYGFVLYGVSDKAPAIVKAFYRDVLDKAKWHGIPFSELSIGAAI